MVIKGMPCLFFSKPLTGRWRVEDYIRVWHSFVHKQKELHVAEKRPVKSTCAPWLRCLLPGNSPGSPPPFQCGQVWLCTCAEC